VGVEGSAASRRLGGEARKQLWLQWECKFQSRNDVKGTSRRSVAAGGLSIEESELGWCKVQARVWKVVGTPVQERLDWWWS
jgi:hypothetical protein